MEAEMTKTKPARPLPLKDDALDRVTGGTDATFAAPAETTEKKPGRTTFANIVLERG
jgi:hypothetical protein